MKRTDFNIIKNRATETGKEGILYRQCLYYAGYIWLNLTKKQAIELVNAIEQVAPDEIRTTLLLQSDARRHELPSGFCIMEEA